MNRILLSVPALLPLAGGMALLLASLFGPLAGKSLAVNRTEGRKSSCRRLFWYVEGITLLNSLVLLWLIVKAGKEESFMLFRLYGELQVMFCLDSMGKVFAGIISFLWPLAVLYSFEYMRDEARKGTFFAFYLMTYGVTAGIALSGNLMTLYLFYELLTLATFPLVLFPMTREAARASRKYLYYSIGGAAFAFLGLVFVLSFSSTGNTRFIPGGILDLGLVGARQNTLLFIYVLAFFGFGVKAVVFPCHKWLPPATVAPTPVTALLHAVAVVKSGAFAILRLTYFSFGAEFLRGTWAQWVVMAAAMVTIIFGSTMAVREAHWKRRLAYSTVSNLSYILLGASMMSPAGLAAALSHMVFHAIMKICSFFCAGAVMHQTGKTYIYELDGLGKRMPITFGCLTVASLSLVGIPLFAGFISKWNIIQAAFGLGLETGGRMGFLCFGAGAVLLYSALMTAVYMLTVLVRAYFPKVSGHICAVAAGDVGNGKNETEIDEIEKNDAEQSGAERNETEQSRTEKNETEIDGIEKNDAEQSGAERNETEQSRIEKNETEINGIEKAGSEKGVREKDKVLCSREPAQKEQGDPNWMMLMPLLIFAVLIIGFGLYSQPLMRFLLMIGGEAA